MSNCKQTHAVILCKKINLNPLVHMLFCLCSADLPMENLFGDNEVIHLETHM